MAQVVLFFPQVIADAAHEEEWRLLPLPLLAIGTPLVRQGYSVRIVDQRVDGRWAETLRQELASGEVLCLGVHGKPGWALRGAMAASRLAKATSPKTPVVWGGVLPSQLPAMVLSEPFVDVVVRGDGEETFPELVRALAEGSPLGAVAGISFKEGGQVAHNPPRPPVELAPHACLNYDLVEVGHYLQAPFGAPRGTLALETSRGCPFNCQFCFSLPFYQRRWRALEPAQVLALIGHLKERYGISNFFLVDANFFVDEERVRAIGQGLVEADLGVRFYNANCRIDTVLRFDGALLALMRRAGFHQLLLGVESGSDPVLDAVGKEITTAQVLAANAKLRQAGIDPVYTFVIGFPGETMAEMKATLGLMARLVEEAPQALATPAGIFTPYPDTPLTQVAAAMGLSLPTTLEGWAQTDSSHLNLGAGLAPPEQRFLEKARLVSSLIDPKNQTVDSPFKHRLRELYAKALRFRLERGLYSLMPEVDLMLRLRPRERNLA